MPEQTLIYFVTDLNYLQVTLVAAQQARHWTSACADVDVVIYTHDIVPELMDQVTAWARPRGIALIPYHTALDKEVARLDFTRNHLSPAALGRLEVAGTIPDTYGRIIYLDGDMQMVGDITPLVDMVPPEGRLLGCVDSSYACALPMGEMARKAKPYLATIGVPDMHHYYNSGLVCARLGDWKRVAGAALAFILDHGERCLHHDQSAINAVAHEAYLPLHPRYNYGPIYRDVHAPFGPVIFHFMGPLKPWTPSNPFGAALAQPYRALKEALPALPETRASAVAAPSRLSAWAPGRRLKSPAASPAMGNCANICATRAFLMEHQIRHDRQRRHEDRHDLAIAQPSGWRGQRGHAPVWRCNHRHR